MKLNELLNTLVEEKQLDQIKKKWQKENPSDSKLIEKYISYFDIIKDTLKKNPVARETIKDFDLSANDRFDISRYKSWSQLKTFIEYLIEMDEKAKLHLKFLDIERGPLKFKTINGLEIFRGDTPRACIRYVNTLQEFDYEWCIADKDKNTFYRNRFDYDNPTFYFVKNIKKTDRELDQLTANKDFDQFIDPLHFFVIQVPQSININDPKDLKYIVWNANNAMVRNDNANRENYNVLSWNEIIKFEPNLKGLQNTFKPLPLTSKEKTSIERFEQELDDAEFAKLTPSEMERYIDVFVRFDIGHNLTDEQFKIMPYELKDKYLRLRPPLSINQYNLTLQDQKLSKGYLKIVSNKFNNWIKSNQVLSFNVIELDLLINKSTVFYDNIANLSDDQLIKIVSHYVSLYKDQVTTFVQLKFPSKDQFIVNVLDALQNKAKDVGDDFIYKILMNAGNKDIISNKIIDFKNVNLKVKTLPNILKLVKYPSFIYDKLIKSYPNILQKYSKLIERPGLDKRDLDNFIVTSRSPVEVIEFLLKILKNPSLKRYLQNRRQSIISQQSKKK